MGASLVIEDLGVWGFKRLLEDGQRYTLGRAPDNDIRLNDLLVSSRHATIFTEADHWIIKDLGSLNGTFINDIAIGLEPLRNGDRLRVGRTEMVFRFWTQTHVDQFWDRTSTYIARQGNAIQQAIIEADREGHVVMPPASLEDPVYETAPEPETERDNTADKDGGYPPTVDPASSQQPDPLTLPLKLQDEIWLAESIVTILRRIAQAPRRSRVELFQNVLQDLGNLIGAENGFVMIPEKHSRRWVIEAGVGNEAAWSPYEKRHPVPLTIANNAYLQDRVISNAIGGLPPLSQSKSFQALHIQFFIAVPLRRRKTPEGLLYFDTRRTLKKFDLRDVHLINRMGEYLLEIESMRTD